MKKTHTVAVLLFAVVAVNAFGQTDNRLLDTRQYAGYFGFNNGEIRLSSEYITTAPRADRRLFADLGRAPESIDTPLEFALLSYYSQPVINIRPVQANTILPANNPRLADQKLGAAVFQELQVLRFLNASGGSADTAAAGRHEAMLQWIAARGNATRAEIEAFYRNGIRGLISEVVDREFNTRSSEINWSEFNYNRANTIRIRNEIITTPITNFYLQPNQTNFARIQRIYRTLNEERIIVLINLYEAGILNAPIMDEVYGPNAGDGLRTQSLQTQREIDAHFQTQLNITNTNGVSWTLLRDVLRSTLRELNENLARRISG